MHGKQECEICKKIFKWRRCNNHKTIPKWCSIKCRKESPTSNFNSGGGPRRISSMTESEKLEKYKESFEKKVIKKFGCWAWSGFLDKNGYGVLPTGKNYGPDRAHRASWIIHYGTIPEGMFVLHKCDNPECTNPEHLFLGTPADNTKDMIDKNRMLIGSKVATAKLSEADVQTIKTLLTLKKSYRQIAKMFNVGMTTIARIKNGKTWKHIEDDKC